MVKIYTTPTCAYCAHVKKFLTSRGVEYEVIDAQTAPEYPELAQTHGFTVPLITNGAKGMVGFNISRLLEVVA